MMRRMPPKFPRRTSAGLILLALLAACLSWVSASAATSATHAAPATRSASRGHFNVGATHSPRLERLLAGRGTVRPAAPAKGSVLGIDVASGQHDGGATIDWPQVAAAGYRFAFIKTTEGSYYANPFFSSDLAGAKAAGLLVAAYHFANPSYSAGTLQADFAVDHAGIGSDGVTLPLIADLEFDPYSSNECYGLTPRQMVGWIRAFTSEVFRLTSQHPVIYTIYDWWDKCTGNSKAFTADPLWVASPYKGTQPRMPVGWTNWTYWQYTASGNVPGITGPAGPTHTDLSAISPAALEVAQPAAQSYQAGSAVSLPIRSVDGSAKQPLSYAATGLPAGLTINPATGLITGTAPATPGNLAATATVSGTSLGPVTVGVAWNLHSHVVLTKPRNRQGTVGSPWLLQIYASDGLPGCTLAFRASGLPPGLTMSPCGRITGWLTRPGSYLVKVSVTDSGKTTLATTSFAWQVDQPSNAGPAGHITNAASCLTRLPARVSIGKCRNIASERWSISPNGELRQGETCLSAGAAGPVQQRHCRGTIFEKWQAGTDAALINLDTGDCLTATTVNKRPTATVAACAGTPAQRWVLPPGPITSGLPGWCASALPASQTSVTLRRCALAGSWIAGPGGALRADGRCLSTTSPAVAGSPVRMERCTGVAAQRWQLFNVLAGVQLVSPEPGLCLADPADSRAAAVKLTLGYCLAADPGVSWHLG